MGSLRSEAKQILKNKCAKRKNIKKNLQLPQPFLHDVYAWTVFQQAMTFWLMLWQFLFRRPCLHWHTNCNFVQFLEENPSIEDWISSEQHRKSKAKAKSRLPTIQYIRPMKIQQKLKWYFNEFSAKVVQPKTTAQVCGRPKPYTE